MPEFDFRLVVVVIGAAITVGSAMVTGLRLHHFAQRHGIPLPKDAAVLCGLVIGLAVITGWMAN